jgi:hypothetical protein
MSLFSFRFEAPAVQICMLTRFALAAALLLSFACGQAADGSSPMDGDDSAPVAAPSSEDLGDAPVKPARVVQSQTPAAKPAPAPVAQPEPEPVAASPDPSPVPSADEPAPAPVASDPDPTPEHPLVIECSDADCASCDQDLRETHPEWAASGAAVCQMRLCSADAECSSLADGLVCRPLTERGRDVCRLPRLTKYASCNPAKADACELGLACQGSTPRCLPL